LTLVGALGGLVAFSQAPEFAQQYRQRLGGAVEELRVVVEDFDKDAQNSGMSRSEALTALMGSAEPLPRDRGVSMERTIGRFENIASQQLAMENGEPLTRPVFLLNKPDEKLLRDTWEIFEPAVPFTLPGLVWGGIGAFLAGFAARIPVKLGGMVRRGFSGKKSKDPIIEPVLARDDDLLVPDVYPETRAVKPSLLEDASEVASGLANRSFLDEVRLDERMLGEIDADGRIVRPRKSLL
jgi:hypothetical protein